MKCPFCDREFLMIEDVAHHLAWHHAGGKYDGTDAQLLRSEMNETIRCWCGDWFSYRRDKYRPMSPFANHLQRNSGPAAHMLELGLNIRREGKP